MIDLEQLADFTDIDVPCTRTDLPTIEEIHPVGGVPGEGIFFCCHDQHGQSVLTFLVAKEILQDEDGELRSQDEVEPVIREAAEKMATAVFN